MEFLILILIFGGFWFIGWVFSAISNIIDEKRAKVRTQVANEVLKGTNIRKNISKYEEKLEFIGYKKEDMFSRYTNYQTQTEAPVTKILGHCPECRDGYLQLRRGPSGKFFGCSNYPNCRHTEVDQTIKKYKQMLGEQFWSDIKEAYS